MREIGEVWKDYTDEYKVDFKDVDAVKHMRLALELVLWNTTAIWLLPFLMVFSMIVSIVFMASNGMLPTELTESGKK